MAATAWAGAAFGRHRVQSRSDRPESSDQVWSKASSETEQPLLEAQPIKSRPTLALSGQFAAVRPLLSVLLFVRPGAQAWSKIAAGDPQLLHHGVQGRPWNVGQAISSASRDLPKTRLAWSRTSNHDANTELGAHVERPLTCFPHGGTKHFERGDTNEVSICLGPRRSRRADRCVVSDESPLNWAAFRATDLPIPSLTCRLCANRKRV
jgi:hypothetical protein